MDERAAHERQNAEVFDPIAAAYDRMGFLTETALHLVACAALKPGERVLDIATGTGTAALAAARAVGPSGTVVGIDLAESMLAVAHSKARRAALESLSFRQADAAHLPFEDGTFDAVLCASALFFMPDIPACLREWRRVLVPGGRVGFTSFAPGLMAPLPALWAQRLAVHGLKPLLPPFGRVPNPEAAQEMLLEAGFTQAQATLDPLPYAIPDPEVRWSEIAAGMEGTPLASLDPGVREQIRTEHLSDLHGLFMGGPLEVRLTVIVALGRA